MGPAPRSAMRACLQAGGARLPRDGEDVTPAYDPPVEGQAPGGSHPHWRIRGPEAGRLDEDREMPLTAHPHLDQALDPVRVAVAGHHDEAAAALPAPAVLGDGR